MSLSRNIRLSAIACAVLCAAVAFAQDDARPKREPAAVMSFHGAAWLERPSREEEEKPYDVLGGV